MAYNNWKLMDKLDVVVKTDPNYRGFTGFIAEHGDAKSLETAKVWAAGYSWENNKGKYKIHTFDNVGFTVKILDSAGGSSQGGRLSFWSAEVEKDGIKFTIGVNDAVMADLIRASDISMGVVKQKVMFARKAGQPGLIHEGMQSYKDAVADMKQKSDLKSAKKTSKWEIGGVYSTLTQISICIGEVFDTMEEYSEEVKGTSSWYSRTRSALRKRKTPVQTTAWLYISRYSQKELPKSFTELLEDELKSNYIYFYTGKPPARPKARQFEVKESDLLLLDKLLKKREEYEGYTGYGNPKVKGRYVREIK